MPRRLIPVGFVLSSLIALFLGAPAGASAEACPQSVYRGSNGGDYPNVQLGWTDNVQGVEITSAAFGKKSRAKSSSPSEFFARLCSKSCSA